MNFIFKALGYILLAMFFIIAVPFIFNPVLFFALILFFLALAGGTVGISLAIFLGVCLFIASPAHLLAILIIFFIIYKLFM